ncbi:hypothetical protein CRN67_08575 [Campylobacter blaseri]|uniref:OmpR/PhoB-type domain-containing protein n=1 Tax=Campylobacter blaseri TaxID=2042961 RepID=A0A2P8QYM1_9BACT|nr:hypothetical protein CQ405_08570 [Campylobacter blaseri]PSM52485.1 hypothetical protein CRN67_08575 [Campylobacter blaseri]
MNTVNCKDFLKFYIDNYNKIDIVLLDIDSFKNVNFEKISAICSNQQFIFLAYKRKNYIDILKNFNCGNSVILFKPIKFSAILDNISMLIKNVKNNEILKINDNIKIDMKKEVVYKNNEIIYLTHTMHKLFLLFLVNLNKITTFYAIEDIVYDGKTVNRYVIQNLVGLLKRELNLNIKNIYGKGYILYDNKDKNT